MGMDYGIVPYGQPGSRLLPDTIIDTFADETLPVRLSNLLKLPPSTRFESLRGFRFPAEAGEETGLACEMVRGMLANRHNDILGLAVVNLPRGRTRFDPHRVPWSYRTRTRLVAAGLMSCERLVRLRFGELLEFQGFGIRSALDFAVTLEEALLRAGSPVTARQRSQASAARLLRPLARKPWAGQISAQDPRFSDLLPGMDIEPLPALIDVILADWGCFEARRAAEVLIRSRSEIRRRVDEISKLPLEQALREFLQRCPRTSGARQAALLARLGWNGARSATLDAAGKQLGITRERMRQIEVAIRRFFPRHPAFMPALVRAMTLLGARCPLMADAAQDLLREYGITRVTFSPESLLAVATQLGHEPSFRLEKVHGVRAISATGDAVWRVYRGGQRLCRATGACAIEHIQGLLKAGRGKQTALFQHNGGRSAIRRLLAGNRRFIALGDDWYCLGAGAVRSHSTLVNVCRKMLSVHSPLPVETLREGLRKRLARRESTHDLRIKLHLPPTGIIRAVLRAHPSFRVDWADRVSCVDDLKPREELSDMEWRVFELLRGAPNGVLNHAPLRRAVGKSGYNEDSASIMMTYSPILQRLGRGIWTLCGRPG